MQVTILGNNSALPAYDRHPTAQVVATPGADLLLLDCGEGTQIQLQRYGVKWGRISHIFISHLHGDHYFGLPGLLNSMSLLRRTQPLHLYAPAGLEGILQQIFAVADTVLCYPFHFHALPEGDAVLVEGDAYTVRCFPTQHRIACHGFVVAAKGKGRKLLPEQCRAYEVPTYYYEQLKQGADYERKDGLIVKNEWVTTDGPTPRQYAYCADTVFTESIVPHIRGVQTIYHESTFLEADAEKATARFHSTAVQAARIAQLARADQLLLGHFSSKYRDTEPFATEAATVFPNVRVTAEGETYEI